jgi:hypothetical protein
MGRLIAMSTEGEQTRRRRRTGWPGLVSVLALLGGCASAPSSLAPPPHTQALPPVSLSLVVGGHHVAPGAVVFVAAGHTVTVSVTVTLPASASLGALDVGTWRGLPPPAPADPSKLRSIFDEVVVAAGGQRQVRSSYSGHWHAPTGPTRLALGAAFRINGGDRNQGGVSIRTLCYLSVGAAS